MEKNTKFQFSMHMNIHMVNNLYKLAHKQLHIKQSFFFFLYMGAILEGGGKLLIWYNMCWNMIENNKKDSSN